MVIRKDNMLIMRYVTIPIVALLVSILIPTMVLAKENDKRDDSATQTNLGEISFRHNDVVTFMGGTNMVNAMKAGYLEALLSKGNASLSLKFRDYSWDADTVFGQGTVIEQWRKKEFGDIIKQLKKAGTTVLVLQFGKMESMQGSAGLNDFIDQYDALLNQLSEVTKRIVTVSPTAFEKTADGHDHNGDLKIYTEAIKVIATKHHYLYVGMAIDDKYVPITRNGIHIKPDRQVVIANHLAQALGIELFYTNKLAPLREAIQYKNKFWNEYQRPKNWKCLFGDDSERIFSIGRGGPQVTLRSEWDQLPEFITFAESRIQDILKGRKPAERKVVNEKLTGSSEANIKKELASFKLDSRYQINAFATEADGIPCPLQMCWDTQGRLYVISSTAYPQVMPGEYANDKIIILEDTNHDGTADKSTVFADGLNIPTGIALGERGVYVAHGTELLFLKDTDGDNKADEREVLFSGFGTQDTHQTSNSLTWSPDGMLLFGQGDGIESRVETAYGFSNVYQAGFYRLNPHNKKLDTILNNWGGPANPWGIVFDDWGQSFSCCGAEGIDYLTQGMLPNEQRRKIKQIGKPGGYCGMEMISSTLMPSDMQGDFIIGDYKLKSIPRFTTIPDGSGFKVKWKEDLLKTIHRNFMPVDIQMGPDGAIYIADWYNPITCHQDDYFRDVARDKTHGRIWRISLKNEAARQPINLTKLNDAELVKQLGSLERWYRYYSRREMTTRNRDHIATEIEKWIEGLDITGDQFEHHLYEAISALASIDRVNEKLLLQLLQAKDYRARAFAAERVGHWHDRLQSPLSLLEKAVGDKHPLVRMKAILGLAHVPDARAVEVAAKVTDMPMDEGIEYAFAQAVNHLKPYWLIEMGNMFQGNPEHLAAVLSQVKSKYLRADLLELANNKSLNPKSRLAVMRRLAMVGNKYDLRMIFESKTYGSGKSYQADMHASLLTRLASVFRAQGIKPQGDLVKTLDELIDNKHTGVKVAAMTLADLWGEKSLQPKILAIAKNSDQPDTVRLAAINAINSSSKRTKAYLSDLALQKSSSMQLAALKSLARIDLEMAAVDAGKILAGNNQVDAAEVVHIFLARSGGSKSLAKALSVKTLSKAKAETCLQAIQAYGRSDKELTAVFENAIGIHSKIPEYNLAYLKALAQESIKYGNTENGKMVFLTAGCITCHQVGNVPAVIGPDLNGLGPAMHIERIVEEVLWPKRNIKEGYDFVTVTTKDGVIHQGYKRTSKDQEDVYLMREMATTVIKGIPRDQIVSVKSSGSAMIPGIVANLKREDLRDLIKYLSTLGTTK